MLFRCRFCPPFHPSLLDSVNGYVDHISTFHKDQLASAMLEGFSSDQVDQPEDPSIPTIPHQQSIIQMPSLAQQQEGLDGEYANDAINWKDYDNKVESQTTLPPVVTKATEEYVDEGCRRLFRYGPLLASKFRMFADGMTYEKLIGLQSSREAESKMELKKLWAQIPSDLFYMKAKDYTSTLDPSVAATLTDAPMIALHHARSILGRYLSDAEVESGIVEEFVNEIGSLKNHLSRVAIARITAALVILSREMDNGQYSEQIKMGMSDVRRLAQLDPTFAKKVLFLFSTKLFAPHLFAGYTRRNLEMELLQHCKCKLGPESKGKTAIGKLVSFKVDGVKSEFRRILSSHQKRLTAPPNAPSNVNRTQVSDTMFVELPKIQVATIANSLTFLPSSK